MNTNQDCKVTNDVSTILRSVLQGIGHKVGDPVVRESVITAADVALLRERPSAAILPETFRRQTIRIVLDGMMERPQEWDGASGNDAKVA